jgi:aspartate/methionine/tyrosine aminotransferase
MSAFAAALIEPGDRVLVTEPGYPAFARVAAQRHARLHVANLDPEQGFAPDLKCLDRSGAEAAIRVAGLNYPNNPTGTLLTTETLAALRERLDPRALIFNDAVYGPLTHEGAPFSMLAGEFDARGVEPIVELHSLGKLFALGPLGVAFLVGPAEPIAKIAQYSDFAWTQLSSLQVRTATRCLESWEHVERRGRALRERLTRLRDVVARLGFEAFPTPAGMYLLCRLPARLGGSPVETATQAAQRLLAEHDLAVAPFEAAPHAYLRFSASYLSEDLDALAELGVGFAES